MLTNWVTRRINRDKCRVHYWHLMPLREAQRKALGDRARRRELGLPHFIASLPLSSINVVIMND